MVNGYDLVLKDIQPYRVHGPYCLQKKKKAERTNQGWQYKAEVYTLQGIQQNRDHLFCYNLFYFSPYPVISSYSGKPFFRFGPHKVTANIIYETDFLKLLVIYSLSNFGQSGNFLNIGKSHKIKCCKCQFQGSFYPHTCKRTLKLHKNETSYRNTEI